MEVILTRMTESDVQAHLDRMQTWTGMPDEHTEDDMKILAIDPGPVQSAWVRWDGCTIHGKGKEPNEQLIDWLRRYTAPNLLAIEQIKSYGMAVSDTVFDTVYWTGRFAEAWSPQKHIRVPRMNIKMALCGSSRAKDGNIIQALCDRFARGEPNRGKGTKSKPGFFYGFSADIWQAFALAVVVFDREQLERKNKP